MKVVEIAGKSMFTEDLKQAPQTLLGMFLRGRYVLLLLYWIGICPLPAASQSEKQPHETLWVHLGSERNNFRRRKERVPPIKEVVLSCPVMSDSVKPHGL